MNFFGIEIGWWDIVTEAVGILGIVAAVIAFQCKRHRNLMIFRTANELLFAVQYGMLGAYTGMAMNLLGSTRNITFAYMVEHKKSTVAARWIFSAVIVAFILLTWEGPKSLLSGIAKTVTTFAYGSSKTSLVRLLTLCTSSAWLVYNLLVSSYAGVACEVFTLVSIIAGIIRIDIRGRKKNVDGNQES